MTESTSDGEAGASDACDGISDTVSPSRREFLKFSAAAGATLLGGCVGDDDSQSDVDAADPAASFA
jgi:hypothetical protein